MVNAAEQGTPIIVVKDSGRAADLLVKTYNYVVEREAKVCERAEKANVFNDETKEHLRKLLIESKMVKSPSRDMINQWLKELEQCMTEHRRLFSFMTLDDDLDLAVLQSLLKNPDMKLKAQMEYCLSFNRIDAARQILDKQSSLHDCTDLHELALAAVRDDRSEFCRELQDRGVRLTEFLTEKSLLELYGQVNEEPLRSLLQKYQTGAPTRASKDSLIGALLGDQLGYSDTMKSDPALELFIYAVLLNRRELAMVYFEKLTEPLLAALVACKLCRALLALFDNAEDAKRCNAITKSADFYEDVAIRVLNTCYDAEQARRRHCLYAKWGC